MQDSLVIPDLIKIPPFFDAHMHFVIDGKPPTNNDLSGIIKKLIAQGIFAVKEMGYKTGIGLEAKNMYSKNTPLKIISSGFAVYKKGTYGVFLGKGMSDKREIKKIVKDIADAGADFLKVVNSGVVCSKGERTVTPGGFTSEEIEIICKEAQDNGLPVSCHANGDNAIRQAVIAGASSIEHGFFISKETINLMVEKGASWTPTVFALLILTSILPTFEKKYIERVVEEHLEYINYASSVGVNLKVGTDSGSRGVQHGESIFNELALFKKAGLSFDKIISGACMDTDEIGKGNYLLVEKDFIETRKIQGVYHNHEKIF